MSWATSTTGVLHLALGEHFDDVRLAEQRVHVIAWLLREAEAEEVEADYPPVCEQLTHGRQS